ncbi:MAG: right-handed parallel beta-helix repeat-containing protein [Proteobacteria bacterium]|nr:right-handed parallel beta-helix repeat-containing protein [Pseudomonadota bacterium]MBU1739045.1 right-handed parallel beta-helix repeat-containing protein [Pseudomonadota bacterium]
MNILGRFLSRAFSFFVLSFLLISCGSGGGGGGEAPPADPPVDPPATSQLSTVGPLYPLNGADWNDYVVGADISSASDTACVAGTPPCIHGGEVRSMEVTGRSSCSGLTASDNLEVFEWMCQVSGPSTIRFVSTGFKQGKGLSNLIDFTGSGSLRQNALTVLDGATQIAHSLPAVWWSNPVLVNNDGSNLSSPGTIYIVTQDANAKYTINADRVALVTKPNLVTIKDTIPSTADPNVSANGFNFLWLEVKADATATPPGLLGVTGGISLTSTRHSVLHNVVADNSAGLGVSLVSASYNRLNNISVSGNVSSGVSLNNSSNNTLSDIVTGGNGNSEITLNNSSNDNILIGVTASGNNSVTGVKLDGSRNNYLSNVTVSGNNHGIELDTSTNNYFGNVLASRNTKNTSIGLYMYNASSDNFINNLTATEDSNYGIRLEGGSSGNTFDGLLQVGLNTAGNCSVVDTSGDLDSSCAGSVASSTTISDPISFVDAAGGDYALKTDDQVVFNKFTALPTGDDVLTDAWFTAPPKLMNAVEISGDGIGNDNLFCESNETCLFTPNMGSYQGHGNLISAGTFTGGTITGVTLLKYQTNGN